MCYVIEGEAHCINYERNQPHLMEDNALLAETDLRNNCFIG
jgi:hypothetical protein